MSNYCDGCRYKPGTRSGEGACPMTVMYWDFMARHARMLENNPRTTVMTENLRRFSVDELVAIRRTAQQMRERPQLL